MLNQKLTENISMKQHCYIFWNCLNQIVVFIISKKINLSVCSSVLTRN